MRNFNAHIGLGKHLMSAACLLFVLAATTSAYSIVMRGGKRIEIPTQFSVTDTTLSYEAAPGFWITLQMAAVDIPATEQANNEVPGSLLARVSKENTQSRTSKVVSQSKAAHTVTNVDLESYKRERLKSEREYDQRQKDQGLPPLAVVRAKAAADDELLRQELARTHAEEDANERALQLQAQIAALSVQLNDLQSGSRDLSSVSPDAVAVYGGSPFFGRRSRVNRGLFRVPFGFQIGGAFGSSNVPFGSPSQFHGRNIIIAPGIRIGGRGGSQGRPHSH